MSSQMSTTVYVQGVSRQKEAPSRYYALLCPTLIEWLHGFFIVHSTIDNTAHSIHLNSLVHCIFTTSMTNIRPDRDSNPVSSHNRIEWTGRMSREAVVTDPGGRGRGVLHPFSKVDLHQLRWKLPVFKTQNSLGYCLKLRQYPSKFMFYNLQNGPPPFKKFWICPMKPTKSHTYTHMLRMTYRPLGYKKVYLSLHKVADTPFYIQKNDIF